MKDLSKSIIVLFCICLVASLLLAVTNFFTAPLIELENEKAAKAACFEVMDGTDFKSVSVPEGSPSAVTAVFEETSGMGYVFKMTVTGYSAGLTIVCGVDMNGLVTGTYTVTTNETPTIGGKTQTPEYTDRFVGKDAETVKGVDGISGATYTSKAYKGAVESALEAFRLMEGK